MKKLKGNKGIKILSGLLILLISLLCLSPQQLVAKECDEALLECSVDAVIVGIFGGPKAGLLYFSGCLIGYGWCLEYM